ncbi:MAG TPA: hypothetical protein PLL64_08875 [Rhodothermales bacterium]|nr:hypothetical protein [Rhodothermales bacterium]HRR10152.1 hypothetical protein [Rhodothermales bacterium]
MTEAQFLELARQRYQEIRALNELDSFYEHEKQSDALWVELGREIMEQNLGFPNRSKKTRSRPDSGR